jgi:DNA-binding transcriptional LysR family regulator
LLVASLDYLATVATPKTPTDLSTHTVINRPGDGGPSWSFRKHGRVASVRVAGRLAVTLNEAVAAPVAGLGIVSTSLWACREEISGGAPVQVLPD